MIYISLLNGAVISVNESKDFYDAVVKQLQDETFTPKYWVTDKYVIPFTSIAYIQFKDKNRESNRIRELKELARELFADLDNAIHSCPRKRTLSEYEKIMHYMGIEVNQ